jgi:hypothetical protein
MTICDPCEINELPNESSKTIEDLCPGMVELPEVVEICIPELIGISNLGADYFQKQMTIKVCAGYHGVNPRADIYNSKVQETIESLCGVCE